MSTLTEKKLPEGYCGLGEVRFDGSEVIIELKMNHSSAIQKRRRITEVRNRTHMHKKLKEACYKIKDMIRRGEIVAGDVFIGGDEPCQLRVQFEDEKLNSGVMNLLEVLCKELDE